MNKFLARPQWAALVLAGLAAAVFANTLPSRFLWDDEQFIYRNAYVATPGHAAELVTKNVVAGAGLVSNLYRPVQSLTHRLDVMLWGLKPWGHHLTNVLLHAAAVAVLFLLLRTLFSPPAAFVAAACFALHPIQTEAVAYVSGRGDLLALLFTSLGLLFFEKRRALSLACAALAVLSKESHALFPVFLALYAFARRRPFRILEHAPYWALSAGYAALRLTVLNFKNTLNFYSAPNILTEQPLSRLWTYCTTLPKGVLLWLWPADLHHERSWSVFASPAAPEVSLGAAFIAVSLFAAWHFRRKDPRVTAGIAWFYAATFPTSNLLVLINAIFYDHWFILPGVGLCWVFAAGVERVDRKGGAVRAAVGVLLAAAAALLVSTTVRYNLVWRTPVSLYSYVLAHEPESAKMTSNLGMSLADEGKTEQAIEYYKRTIAISDEYPETRHNLGMSYLALNRVDEAEREYKRALEIDPQFFHSMLYLGMIEANRGNFAESRRYFEKVLEIYPYSEPAKDALARLEKISAQG